MPILKAATAEIPPTSNITIHEPSHGRSVSRVMRFVASFVSSTSCLHIMFSVSLLCFNQPSVSFTFFCFPVYNSMKFINDIEFLAHDNSKVFP
ncbi:MAG: hypothetical protein CMI26_03880 [Opitutae bacterium]|nr:hypothetical protein [Opitutae bacterium]